MKKYPRLTNSGVKNHRYWVISHKPSGQPTVTHYVGKTLKGNMKKLRRKTKRTPKRHGKRRRSSTN